MCVKYVLHVIVWQQLIIRHRDWCYQQVPVGRFHQMTVCCKKELLHVLGIYISRRIASNDLKASSKSRVWFERGMVLELIILVRSMLLRPLCFIHHADGAYCTDLVALYQHWRFRTDVAQCRMSTPVKTVLNAF